MPADESARRRAFIIDPFKAPNGCGCVECEWETRKDQRRSSDVGRHNRFQWVQSTLHRDESPQCEPNRSGDLPGRSLIFTSSSGTDRRATLVPTAKAARAATQAASARALLPRKQLRAPLVPQRHPENRRNTDAKARPGPEECPDPRYSTCNPTVQTMPRSAHSMDQHRAQCSRKSKGPLPLHSSSTPLRSRSSSPLWETGDCHNRSRPATERAIRR